MLNAPFIAPTVGVTSLPFASTSLTDFLTLDATSTAAYAASETPVTPMTATMATKILRSAERGRCFFSRPWRTAGPAVFSCARACARVGISLIHFLPIRWAHDHGVRWNQRTPLPSLAREAGNALKRDNDRLLERVENQRET